MQDIAQTVYSTLQSTYQTISDIGIKNLLLFATWSEPLKVDK